MASSANLSIAMVAGEPSGDMLAARLLSGLRLMLPDARLHGIGGPQMAEHGFVSDYPMEKLAVRGVFEVLAHYREIKGIRDSLCAQLLDEKPAAFIGIDAPDFNFGLETRLREAGLKTIHFVCPSIWAWRGERVAKLQAAADHVLCLFPFEPELLRAAGVAASYVGHPLADAISLDIDHRAARHALGLGDEPVVALLPGSRRSEIRHIAPLLMATAQELLRQRPGLRFLLPVAPGLSDLLQPLAQPLVQSGHLTLLAGRSHEALAGADVALVASGTATLEAALLRCPQVIVYRLAAADWQRMRRMRLQPWVGLPNILSSAFIVPERIQDEALPEVVAADALRWLDDPQAVEVYRAQCRALHQTLRQDTGARAAQVIRELVGA